MGQKIESPNQVIDKIMSKRLESNKELSSKFSKLYDYIKPFVEQNKEMKELMNSIKFSINIGLNTDDLVLFTGLMTTTLTQELMRPRLPMKIKCHKCGELVMDMSALEEAFDKKFGYDKLRKL